MVLKHEKEMNVEGNRERNFLFTIVGLIIQIVILLFFTTKLIVF